MTDYRMSTGGHVHPAAPPCTSPVCTPVVVIDPEDREQVARLLSGYADWKNDAEALEEYPSYVSDMQDALRSLIAPPKPPEPQGLGAVVEDVDDECWVRVFLGPVGGAWQRYNSELSQRNYESIAAVKVLSEGVTP